MVYFFPKTSKNINKHKNIIQKPYKTIEILCFSPSFPIVTNSHPAKSARQCTSAFCVTRPPRRLMRCSSSESLLPRRAAEKAWIGSRRWLEGVFGGVFWDVGISGMFVFLGCFCLGKLAYLMVFLVAFLWDHSTWYLVYIQTCAWKGRTHLIDFTSKAIILLNYKVHMIHTHLIQNQP